MINEADSFADKLERHRRFTTSEAAYRHNEYITECRNRGVVLCESDIYAIWQGCINAAEVEWRARTPEDRRALPDYRRPA